LEQDRSDICPCLQTNRLHAGRIICMWATDYAGCKLVEVTEICMLSTFMIAMVNISLSVTCDPRV